VISSHDFEKSPAMARPAAIIAIRNAFMLKRIKNQRDNIIDRPTDLFNGVPNTMEAVVARREALDFEGSYFNTRPAVYHCHYWHKVVDYSNGGSGGYLLYSGWGMIHVL
jgi:hypothetical protein